MQATQPITQLPSAGRLAEVKQLISQYLCGNCALCIEHTPRVVEGYVRWQQWGQTFYALQDSTPVIDEIIACRAQHPKHTIRLCAERLRPRSRLVFWI